MKNISIGFIGAGGIARAHAFSLTALKFYYPQVPELCLESVTSLTEKSRNEFAQKYGFQQSQEMEQFFSNKDLNTVFILGPNNSHYAHLERVLQMPAVTHIYLEKPVCANEEEENKMKEIIRSEGNNRVINIGFQLLQMSAIRKALSILKIEDFGEPQHFHFTLKHSDYLQPSYRQKRATRLTPAPDGGAMADLGSHAISLAIAFLGNNLEIVSALQGGSFSDVHPGSDLYSEISLMDKRTKAVGTISASRISSGTGDLLAFEINYKKGAIKFSSSEPDHLKYFLEKEGKWMDIFTGSDFLPFTSFPSVHVPGGWLRSLIHAHYQFLMNETSDSIHPDLSHGLEVQRLVRETAGQLEKFRNKFH